MPYGILKASFRYVDVIVWLRAQMLYDNSLRRILWFEIQRSNAANPSIWIILWKCPSHESMCTLSFRMLRCCSTIISGQCFWEEQPRLWGNAGTVVVVVVKWRAAVGMAHVFHLLGNSYGSLCNHRSLLCATTWLLCCDGGLQRDEAASIDVDRLQVGKKNPKENTRS